MPNRHLDGALKRGTRGLTLAELILALGILSVVALSLLAAFLAGTQLLSESNNITAATEVGREFLEQVRADGYEATAVGRFDGRIPNPRDGATQFPPSPYPMAISNDIRYTLLVSCEQYSPTTRLVRVESIWGADRRINLTTMVHQ